MVKLSSFSYYLQPVQFTQGGCVRYIGADPKLQQDYGNQDLRILAIDAISGITVCENEAGLRLVGASYRDLQWCLTGLKVETRASQTIDLLLNKNI